MKPFGVVPLLHCQFCYVPMGKYGSRPSHLPTCACLIDKKKYDVTCACGHWGGMHYSPGDVVVSFKGCPVEGCDCSAGWKDFGNEPAKAPVCDCGGAKLGYPPGTMHSFWNHPKDKSKWCPLRTE